MKQERLTPQQEHQLAEALDRFTNPTHAEYDPVFDAEIRKIAPHWFEKN